MSGPAMLQDKIAMRGDLTIRILDAITRRQIRRIEIRNKITFLAADVLVEMLAQRASDPVPARNMLYSMRMGSGTTPPERSDTNLGAYVIGVVLSDVNKVTGLPGELQLIATLESGDGNGNTLSEAGLFTAGATPSTSNAPGTAPGTTRMFSRQIHAPIDKTVAITLEYSWRIALTA